jgi:phenylpyruvate tautomerase PptA (4-oxalocrotonate tautomerase family)
MKKLHVIILVLFTALFFGNPSEEQHKKKIAESILTMLRLDTGNKAQEFTARILVDEVTYKNYYLISVCSAEGTVISYGFLRIVEIDQSLLLKFITSWLI